MRNEMAMDQRIPFHVTNKKSGVRKLTTSFLEPNTALKDWLHKQACETLFDVQTAD